MQTRARFSNAILLTGFVIGSCFFGSGISKAAADCVKCSPERPNIQVSLPDLSSLDLPDGAKVYSFCRGTGNVLRHGRDLKVISYNIASADIAGSAEGLVDRFDRDAPDFDVLALQEVRRSDGGLLARAFDQAEMFARKFRLCGVFIPTHHGNYGVALLSRFPLSGASALQLPKGLHSHDPDESRTLAEIKIPIQGGGELTVLGTHFSLDQGDQARSVHLIRSQYRRFKQEPLILMGDLNSVPGTPTLRDLEAPASDALVLQSVSSRLHVRGLRTFPSSGEEMDHVLITPGKLIPVEIRVLHEMQGASDHDPLFARLRIH